MDEEIKKECQSWTADEWDKYLKNTVDVPLSESFLNNAVDSEYLTNEEYQLGFVDALQKEHFPELEKFLHLAIAELSSTQRKIIYRSFWKGKSLSEQAFELSLTKQAVHGSKQRALEKLSKQIIFMVKNLREKG